MNMKTMTARDAKNHFGEFLDTMQREPVVITKNKRPVGIMLSMDDAQDTLVADFFMKKEEGYDAWVTEKVSKTIQSLDVGTMTSSPLATVRSRINERLNNRFKTVA